MDQAAKDLLKIKIEALIIKTNKEVAELEELTQPISPENSLGRVSRMDAINNKSVAEAALRSTKRKLSKLKVSLSKINNDDFGVCAMCKNPIPPARLMYMPESSRCVRCADR